MSPIMDTAFRIPRLLLAVFAASAAPAWAQSGAPPDFATGPVAISRAVIGPGDTVDVRASVGSVGNDYQGNIEVDVYFSVDRTVDAADFQALRDRLFIPGRGSVDFMATVSTPTLPPGSYYVLVQANPRNLPAETNRSNNVGTTTGTIAVEAPDLEVVDLNCGDFAVIGSRHGCRMVMRNLSPTYAAQDFRYAHYIQSPSTRLDIQVFVSGPMTLGPSTTSTVIYDFIVPTTIPVGPREVTAVLDVFSSVAEESESNNLGLILGFQFRAPAPDLAPQLGSTPSQLAVGEGFNLRRTLRNLGPQAVAQFEYEFYLQPVPLSPIWGTPLKAVTASLAAGAAYSGIGKEAFSDASINIATERVVIPSTVPPGDYFVLLVADRTNAVSELLEDNNVSISERLSVVPSAVVFLTTSLPTGELGRPYSTGLEAQASGPITWSVIDGTLPPGLLATDEARQVFAESGVLTGIPTEVGIYRFTVRASAPDGANERSFEVAIGETGPFRIDTESLPPAFLGRDYSARWVATGGVPPYRWTVISLIAPGINFGEETNGMDVVGRLSGTPTAEGNFAVTLQAIDASGETATAQLLLYVRSPEQTVRVEAASLPEGTVGKAYCGIGTVRLQSRMGIQPVGWTALDPLPPGLSLNASGELCGTPEQVGTYNFSVRARDTAGYTDDGLLFMTIVGNTECAVATVTLPRAIVNQPYWVTDPSETGIALANVSCEPPLTWSVVEGGGDLPPGLSLSEAGLLAGTPTEVGLYAFLVQVEDNQGSTDRQPLSLSVERTQTLDLARDEEGCRCADAPAAPPLGTVALTLLLLLLSLALRRRQPSDAKASAYRSREDLGRR